MILFSKLNEINSKFSEECNNNIIIKIIEFKPSFDINNPEEISENIYQIFNYFLELIYTLQYFGKQNDSILIFLPGIAEITALKKLYNSKFFKNKRIKIYKFTFKYRWRNSIWSF